MLRKMMARRSMRRTLTSATVLALRAEDKLESKHGLYRPITPVFCDGIEVCMGPNTSTLKMQPWIPELTKGLHCVHDGLRLSCINTNRRNERTYLWMTITSETRNVDS